MNSCHKSENDKPTSSPTENDFSIIKNDLFKKARNMRIDEWLKLHIKFTKNRLTGKKPAELMDLFDDSVVGDVDGDERQCECGNRNIQNSVQGNAGERQTRDSQYHDSQASDSQANDSQAEDSQQI